MLTLSVDKVKVQSSTTFILGMMKLSENVSFSTHFLLYYNLEAVLKITGHGT